MYISALFFIRDEITMSEQSFSALLRKNFGKASEALTAALGRETLIDGRTCGFSTEFDNGRVEWMGMTPDNSARGRSADLWHIVRVEEEFNQFLSQVEAHDRLVKFEYHSDKQPLTFAQALERLAVWENAKLVKGFTPHQGQSKADLGRHHFRDIGLRKNFLISTTGTASFIKDKIPTEGGKYLKADIDALNAYRNGFSQGDILAQIIDAHEPLRLYHTSLQEDMEQFGDINLFGAMRFFAQSLNEYATVKLRIIEEFYADPKNINKQTLIDRLNDDAYFGDDFYNQYNEQRSKFGMSIFRMFHVVGSDWNEPLDFESHDLKVEMTKNPDARATYRYINEELSAPFTDERLDAMLTICARGLLYCAQMLEDSPQRTALERLDIYRNEDVYDLLNSLDLLEIKFMYTELASAGFKLPGSHEYRRVRQQKQELEFRVKDLKANLRENGQLSAGQEKQIDLFIKAKSPVYLIDRIKQLPERLGAAHDFVTRAILPDNHQLSLPLDFSNCAKPHIAAPTKSMRQDIRQWKARQKSGPTPKN